MTFLLRLAALASAAVLAACGTIGPGYAPVAQAPAVQSAPPQTAELESEPTDAPPRRRPRRTARAEVEATSSVVVSKPVVYNSPEWKEREKRRDEELNRKINSICRGC